MEAIRKSKKVNDENFINWVNSQQMSSAYNFSVRKIEKSNNLVNSKIAKRKYMETKAELAMKAKLALNGIAVRENVYASSPMFVPNKPSVKKYKRLITKKNIYHG